jgi:hypothetical protein
VLDGGNIDFNCPGNWQVKGSQHAFLGGESGQAVLPSLPTGAASALGILETPLQQTYSLALDTENLPTEWLPVGEGRSAYLLEDGKLLGALNTPAGSAMSNTLMTAQPQGKTLWYGGLGRWTASEDVLQPEDQENQAGEPESEAEDE